MATHIRLFDTTPNMPSHVWEELQRDLQIDMSKPRQQPPDLGEHALFEKGVRDFTKMTQIDARRLGNEFKKKLFSPAEPDATFDPRFCLWNDITFYIDSGNELVGVGKSYKNRWYIVILNMDSKEVRVTNINKYSKLIAAAKQNAIEFPYSRPNQPNSGWE